MSKAGLLRFLSLQECQVYRIVVICTGNICRSPTAEGLLRNEVEKLGRSDIIVSSMGIRGLNHKVACDQAVNFCRERGVDISKHLSRPLDAQELSASDLVLAMDLFQVEFIRLYFPSAADRVYLLGSFPEPAHKKGVVPDPIGGGWREHEKAYRLIENHVQRVIPIIDECLQFQSPS
jgi:protein-tyrosine phosphatase